MRVLGARARSRQQADLAREAEPVGERVVVDDLPVARPAIRSSPSSSTRAAGRLDALERAGPANVPVARQWTAARSPRPRSSHPRGRSRGPPRTARRSTRARPSGPTRSAWPIDVVDAVGRRASRPRRRGRARAARRSTLGDLRGSAAIALTLPSAPMRKPTRRPRGRPRRARRPRRVAPARCRCRCPACRIATPGRWPPATASCSSTAACTRRGSMPHLERALDQVGLRLEHVRLLVCTHAHSTTAARPRAVAGARRLRAWLHPRHEHLTAGADDPERDARAPARDRPPERRPGGAAAALGRAPPRPGRGHGGPAPPRARPRRRRHLESDLGDLAR